MVHTSILAALIQIIIGCLKKEYIIHPLKHKWIKSIPSHDWNWCIPIDERTTFSSCWIKANWISDNSIDILSWPSPSIVPLIPPIIITTSDDRANSIVSAKPLWLLLFIEHPNVYEILIE